MGSLVISPFSFLKLVTCVFSLYFFAELECYLKCPQVIQEVGSLSGVKGPAVGCGSSPLS